MVLGALLHSWAMIFCLRMGIRAILALTALITFGVRTTRGWPDLLRSFTPPVSWDNLTARYTKTRVIFNGFNKSKIRALSILHLKCYNGNAILFVWPFHPDGTSYTEWIWYMNRTPVNCDIYIIALIVIAVFSWLPAVDNFGLISIYIWRD